MGTRQSFLLMPAMESVASMSSPKSKLAQIYPQATCARRIFLNWCHVSYLDGIANSTCFRISQGLETELISTILYEPLLRPQPVNRRDEYSRPRGPRVRSNLLTLHFSEWKQLRATNEEPVVATPIHCLTTGHAHSAESRGHQQNSPQIASLAESHPKNNECMQGVFC